MALVLVPSAAGTPQEGMSARRALQEVRKWPLLRVGLTITVLMLAHFTVYTYVEPLLRGAGVPEQHVSLVLLGYGIASVAGLLTISKVADRRPSSALRVTIGLMAASLLSFGAVQTSPVAASIAVVLWGLTFGAMPVLTQVLALRAAKDAAEVAPSVVNMTSNIGITLGSLAGGQLIAAGSLHLIPMIGAALLAVMVLTVLIPRWLPAETTTKAG